MQIVKIYFTLFFLLSLLCANGQKHSDSIQKEVDQVVPINWSKINGYQVKSPEAKLMGKILLNANKYALTSWWKIRGFEGVPYSDYLNFKGISEHKIRPIAAEAEALAVSLKTNLYDPIVTGISRKEAEAKTIHLIRSLAHAHLANQSKGWGRAWQSPMWAAYTAYAAWIMWDQLTNDTRRLVLRMINTECTWVMGNKHHDKLKTYRNLSGKIVSPGDTGAEENAWDGLILGVAYNMMPQNKQSVTWLRQLVKLSLNAMSRPSDLQCNKKYNGVLLKDWLVGTNLNEDGTVVNHHMIHPDYMTSPFESNSAKFFLLANNPIPKALKLNADLIFHALADIHFKQGDSIVGGRVEAPGGTIFIPGTGDIFYPIGTDWGKSRRMNFAAFNAIIASFTKKSNIRKRAQFFELKQGEIALQMQKRFDDGHTYLSAKEDSYASRESWIADAAATAYIFNVFESISKLRFSNKPI